jgi:hypothetical protein
MSGLIVRENHPVGRADAAEWFTSERHLSDDVPSGREPVIGLVRFVLEKYKPLQKPTLN